MEDDIEFQITILRLQQRGEIKMKGYIVTYKYTLLTGPDVLIEDLPVTAEFLRDVILNPNDIFNHILISAKIIE